MPEQGACAEPAGRFWRELFFFLNLGEGVWCLCFSSSTTERACEESKRDDVLTDKFDRLIEKGADISFVVVLDRDALVEEGVLKVVGAVGRHID